MASLTTSCSSHTDLLSDPQRHRAAIGQSHVILSAWCTDHSLSPILPCLNLDAIPLRNVQETPLLLFNLGALGLYYIFLLELPSLQAFQPLL